MTIQPYILGSGNAAQALRDAWAIVGAHELDVEIKKPIQLQRGQSLSSLKLEENSILCIANPSGLHAKAIFEADAAGFKMIVSEKPACTNLVELKRLRSIKTPVVICHVYRQLWGIQKLRHMVSEGEFGKLIAVEGRYWQSSAAQRAIGLISGGGWKNDQALSGPFDALLDVGTHWADAALFVTGATMARSQIWLSYVNGEAAHRDTHVQWQGTSTDGTNFFASISKTIHGAPNHFELNVIGSKKSATWKFLEPDQIQVGSGNVRSFVARARKETPHVHPPFHGAGWIEGYFNILTAALASLRAEPIKYPTLAEHLNAVEALIGAEIHRQPLA